MLEMIQSPAPELSPALEDLDTWDSAIAHLNTALVDAATARERLADAQAIMDREEARAILGCSGGNAESRKAAVLLALTEETPAYMAAFSQARDARRALADAERRLVVTKERCRLLRAAVTLAAGNEA